MGVGCADKALILAVEKRWNFTLRDMEARAPAFQHLCSLIHLQSNVGQGDDREALPPFRSGQGPGSTDLLPDSSPTQIEESTGAMGPGLRRSTGLRGAEGRKGDAVNLVPERGGELQEGVAAARCDPEGAKGRAAPRVSMGVGRGWERPRTLPEREVLNQNQRKCRFVGSRVAVDSVRQYLAYERGPDLELLELRLA